MNEEQLTTRRTFYQRVIYGMSSLMTAALALPAVGYLFVPSRNRQDTGWTDAGSITTLQLNTPKELVLQRKRIDGWKISAERATAWVVRTDQEVIAFAPQCTHLGCGYHWEEEKQQFVCPCHDSVFSIDGQVVGGPAPRSLDRYEVRVEGERLWLGRVASSMSEETAL